MNANSDALLGMAWWNTASKATRARWLAAAGSAVPAQAWECFKRSSALPREPAPYFGVVEGGAVDIASNAANFWPEALKEPAFVSWAHRITMKVLNLSDPGNALARTNGINAAFLSEGVISSQWAQAYIFMLSMTDLSKPSLLAHQHLARSTPAALGDMG